jgi:hypothetical protein
MSSRIKIGKFKFPGAQSRLSVTSFDTVITKPLHVFCFGLRTSALRRNVQHKGSTLSNCTKGTITYIAYYMSDKNQKVVLAMTSPRQREIALCLFHNA